jgi:hypothetical protein
MVRAYLYQICEECKDFRGGQYRRIGTGLAYGIICGLTAVSLVFLYWRQEVARPAVRTARA